LEQLEDRLLFDAAPIDPAIDPSQGATSPKAHEGALSLAQLQPADKASPRAPLSEVATQVAAQSADADADRWLAFPGAAGFGAFAQGGRGGDVYHVTNLEDSGAGSLREAIDSAVGPRTIVFDVSGTIELNSRLNIDNPYLTIAGQTAPGDGITLKNHGLAILDTHDIILRYLRLRPGDSAGAENDSLAIYGSHDVMVDHVSASWAVDENVDTYQSTNVTVQWSIISEGLHDSAHHKGPHSSGSLHSGGAISMHHNLFIHNQWRNPLVRQQADVVNNVIYDWGSHATITGWSSWSPDPEGVTEVNLQNNYYVAGPSTDDSAVAYLAQPVSRLWQSGNMVDADRDGLLSRVPLTQFSGRPEMVESRFDYPVVPTDDPLTAYHRVLADAGASLARDAVDQRLIQAVIQQTGRIINSQDDVGGWPLLHSNPTPQDSDQDGMPDLWEDSKPTLDPQVPSDGNALVDGIGMTHLEHYLAAVAAGDPALLLTGPEVLNVGAPGLFVTTIANPLFDSTAQYRLDIDWDADGNGDKQRVTAADGSTAHTFSESGTYVVTATLTDGHDRSWTSARVVTVTAPYSPPEPPPDPSPDPPSQPDPNPPSGPDVPPNKAGPSKPNPYSPSPPDAKPDPESDRTPSHSNPAEISGHDESQHAASAAQLRALAEALGLGDALTPSRGVTSVQLDRDLHSTRLQSPTSSLQSPASSLQSQTSGLQSQSPDSFDALWDVTRPYGDTAEFGTSSRTSPHVSADGPPVRDHSQSRAYYEQQVDGQDELVREGLLPEADEQVEEDLVWFLPPEPLPIVPETFDPADQAADSQSAAQDEFTDSSGEGDTPEQTPAQRDAGDQPDDQTPPLEGDLDSPPSKSAASPD
jgi:pectate lyase